jgi:hypothetical protein
VYGEISTLTSDGTIVTFAPTVTTGTGASSGVVMAANSLTTGTGFNISSSSVTSGSLVNIASTSTAAASSTLKALNIAVSGANGTTAQTVTGAAISVTNTNATSGTNVALTLTASGATTANTALNVTAGQILTAVNGALSTGNGPAILATGTWITGGSATTTKPYVLIETTGATSTGWNTSGTGLGINAATGFAGNLLDLQVNGISKSKFTSTGALNINSTGASFGDDVAIYAGTTSTLNSRVAVIGNNATGLRMSSSYAVQWSANAVNGGDANSSIDLTLRRAAAANLAFGAVDAASPVAQTLSVQNVVAGTSNTAGVDWTFKGSAGTGTGAGGKLIFQTAPAGSSGTSQNSFVTGMTLQSDGVVVYKSVTFANLPTVVNGGIIYCSDCTLASPCASGGSGALAKGINSAWVCN